MRPRGRKDDACWYSILKRGRVLSWAAKAWSCAATFVIFFDISAKSLRMPAKSVGDVNDLGAHGHRTKAI